MQAFFANLGFVHVRNCQSKVSVFFIKEVGQHPFCQEPPCLTAGRLCKDAKVEKGRCLVNAQYAQEMLEKTKMCLFCFSLGLPCSEARGLWRGNRYKTEHQFLLAMVQKSLGC